MEITYQSFARHSFKINLEFNTKTSVTWEKWQLGCVTLTKQSINREKPDAVEQEDGIHEAMDEGEGTT